MRKIFGIQLSLLLTIITMGGASSADTNREDLIAEINRMNLILIDFENARTAEKNGINKMVLQIEALKIKSENSTDIKIKEQFDSQIKFMEEQLLATEGKLIFVEESIASIKRSLAVYSSSLAALPSSSPSPNATSTPIFTSAAKIRVTEIENQINSLELKINSSTVYIDVLKTKLAEMKARLSAAADSQTKINIANGIMITTDEISKLTSAISNAKSEIRSLSAERAQLFASASKPPIKPSPSTSPKPNAAKKPSTITCQKGKSVKRVMGYNPSCPKGYAKL